MPESAEGTPFQHLYGAILLAIVAVLVLASLAYGGRLGWVKVLIGVVLLGVSGWLLGRWARARRGPRRRSHRPPARARAPRAPRRTAPPPRPRRGPPPG